LNSKNNNFTVKTQGDPEETNIGNVNSNNSNGAKHPFKQIFALFRHDSFLVNTQAHPNISVDAERGFPTASFDIYNQNFWAAFSNTEYEILKHPGCEITSFSSQFAKGSHSVLYKSISMISSDEVAIENAIQAIVRAMRNDLGLQTVFDEKLAVILQPALLAYEMDRAVGCSFGNQDFQTAVKRVVARGECFKAYPTCFSFAHIPAILSSLKKVGAFRDVVKSGTGLPALVPTGSGAPGVLSQAAVSKLTRHAVRVKIVQYPEQVCSVWVIIAVCFAKQ
jgi:hypothetical protein